MNIHHRHHHRLRYHHHHDHCRRRQKILKKLKKSFKNCVFFTPTNKFVGTAFRRPKIPVGKNADKSFEFEEKTTHLNPKSQIDGCHNGLPFYPEGMKNFEDVKKKKKQGKPLVI